MSNVRNYTDEELLNRVSSIDGFKGFPDEYWGIGVSSNEDQPDVFDDKFYLFKGKKFITVTSFTTNTGKYGLMNFKKWNNKGAFVIEKDQWIYDFWKTAVYVDGKRTYAKHKGRMKAWRQNKPCYGYRDSNMNDKAEQIGGRVYGMYGINFHTVTYKLVEIVKKYIGGWSVGCQVVNDTKKYYDIIERVYENQDTISYCILEEF